MIEIREGKVSRYTQVKKGQSPKPNPILITGFS